jgi:hypothetical protein
MYMYIRIYIHELIRAICVLTPSLTKTCWLCRYFLSELKLPCIFQSYGLYVFTYVHKLVSVFVLLHLRKERNGQVSTEEKTNFAKKSPVNFPKHHVRQKCHLQAESLSLVQINLHRH